MQYQRNKYQTYNKHHQLEKILANIDNDHRHSPYFVDSYLLLNMLTLDG